MELDYSYQMQTPRATFMECGPTRVMAVGLCFFAIVVLALRVAVIGHSGMLMAVDRCILIDP